MKTITREDFFQYMNKVIAHYESIGKPTEILVASLESLQADEFDEVEVIPPQHQGDNWSFQPIFSDKNTDEEE